MLALTLAAGCTGADAGRVDLAKACPATVVVQTDWFPGPEWGALYQLLVDGGGALTVDDQGVSGPLGRTGVRLAVRAGGPALGGESVASRMYADQSILLGAVSTGQAVAQSADLATVGVVSPLDASPRALMWDPATVPASDLAGLGALGERVRVVYADGDDGFDVLASKGLVERAQLDPSADGSDTTFTSEAGIAQEVMATGDPYAYQHELAEWRKPVRFELLDRSGYRPYPALAVRADAMNAQAACLSELVPLIQRAQADYLADPGPVNARIPALSKPFTDFRPVSTAAADDAVRQLKALGLAGTGTVGDFDEGRVAKVVADALPAIKQADPEAGLAAVKPGVGAGDLVTNRFIDAKITLR